MDFSRNKNKTQMTKEKWKSLTKAEKRVFIAKDVIKQIGKKKIIAKNTNGYYSTTEFQEAFDKLAGKEILTTKVELQTVFKNTKQCTVCAQGALLLSDILQRNRCKISYEDFDKIDEREFIKSRLRSYWSQLQLELIETAFEESIMRYMIPGLNIKLYDEAAYFGIKTNTSGNYNADKRLVAIMKNIIKNKGTFKP